MSEKTHAHSDYVMSVAFSPDGTKVFSGSRDGTIKVWDSGAPPAQNRPSLAKTDACWLVAGGLELLSEKTNAQSDRILSVAFSPDGTKIVSGSTDGTIKVWDSSGAPPAQNRPSLAKIDACWLVCQANWSC